MAEYKIIGQRPLVALDNANQLRRSVEITFTYGNGFTGTVLVPEDSATPESIRKAIEDYVKRFTVADGE